jgi:glutaconate CoA-transferase, subunit B
LVARVKHITSPGNGDGAGWRSEQGLPPHSGPSAIITTMGVLRFGEDGEAFLASIHPGISLQEVKNNTGWPIRVAKDLVPTSDPTEDDLAALREIDPTHFWTKA